MTKQQLIERLNEDLAGEYGAIIQYLTYAAKATGPYRPQLAEFFLRRPVLAGALLGALVIKPHLALLVPFWLAAGGQWRAFAAAAASAAGLLVLAWAGHYWLLLAASAMVGLGSAVFHPESSRIARAAWARCEISFFSSAQVLRARYISAPLRMPRRTALPGAPAARPP